MRGSDEVPLHFFGKVVVLLLPVAPEDRLEHILRIGGLLGTFAAKMAHRRWRSAQVPGLTGIFLHIDLRHHAAVGRADKRK